MQQGVPRTGRALPGMPFEMQDPDGDDPPRSNRGVFGAAPAHWWRPASTAGRVFLGLGALIVLAGLATAGEVFKTYLERDARFRITGASNIQVTGLTEVSRSQMLPVFGEDIGRNVFFVPITQRRKDLEAIPWIEHATVMRVLPDQIRVNVIERQPVAFTRHGQQIGLVDANGVLLDMSAATMAVHHYSFPVVTGLDPGDSAASRKGRMALYGRLMAELDANNQHFSQQISEIDITDPEDARVLMPEQGSDILAHFGEDHFLERYQRYKAHIAEWRQQYPRLATVDLRYDHQVVLEMASGVNATQPALSSSAVDPPSVTPPSVAKSSGEAPLRPAPASLKTMATKPSPRSVPGKVLSGRTAKSKPATKSPSSSSTKAKAKAAAKTKASQAQAAQDKKRAQAKPVALNLNNRKPSPIKRAPAPEGQ
ncbi:MAG: FtsQ-type POTRA domain-containing protein [Terracidiphilus sp.]